MANDIDNVPMPCNIIVILVFLLCRPHEFGLSGDADTVEKSRLGVREVVLLGRDDGSEHG